MDTSTIVWIVVAVVVVLLAAALAATLAKRSRAHNAERKREEAVQHQREAEEQMAHAQQRDADAAELKARALRQQADADAMKRQAQHDLTASEQSAAKAQADRHEAAEKQAKAREVLPDGPGHAGRKTHDGVVAHGDRVEQDRSVKWDDAPADGHQADPRVDQQPTVHNAPTDPHGVPQQVADPRTVPEGTPMPVDRGRHTR